MQSQQAHISSRAGTLYTPLDPRSAVANTEIGVMVDKCMTAVPEWFYSLLKGLAAPGLPPALVTRSDRGASKMWQTRVLAARSSDV